MLNRWRFQLRRPFQRHVDLVQTRDPLLEPETVVAESLQGAEEIHLPEMDAARDTDGAKLDMQAMDMYPSQESAPGNM